MPPQRRPVEQRFWPKVQKGDGCWLWTGSRIPAGYGVLGSGGKRGRHVYAHRVSWELANGPIPFGRFVLHRCDNPPCVNPAHLFVGTPRDNMRDKIGKGRAVVGEHSGERNGRAKMDVGRVQSIRRLRRDHGLPADDLAWLFSISPAQALRIVNGTGWRNV